jgi:saccharopine dehydrogenase (NAD+, L-lysine-forming)
VVVLPGIGFDVVPTDCLAVTVAAALPGASTLDLAFLPGSGPSGGTARTAVAMLRGGGRARINGVITPVRVGWRSLTAEFPSGPSKVSSVPWGDVSTAYYSTGIPTITTYTPTPAGGSAAAALLRFGPAAAMADALARRVRGPGSSSRARGHAEVWARASHGSRAATATMTTPNPYDLTADSVVRAAVRLAAQPPAASGPAADSGAAGVPVVLAGVHTPATAFGSGYAAELDGVVQGPVRITS